MVWIIGILLVGLLGYYCLFYVSNKEQEEKHTKKAFEITKKIGDQNVRCVSVKTTLCDKPGRAFYLLEEGAETDSTKRYELLDEGWENSAHSVEEARQNAYSIIRHMPYKVWIEELDVTRYDFFLPRVRDKKYLSLQQAKERDQKRIDYYFWLDFEGLEICIERYVQSYVEGRQKYQDYWYLMKVGTDEDAKYIALFNYLTDDIDYANERVRNYITYFNRMHKLEHSTKRLLQENVVIVDVELEELLKSNPYYTHQFAYQGLHSIKRYNEEYD